MPLSFSNPHLANEISASVRSKPTWASAADQGVRPTIYAECPGLGNYVESGESGCQPISAPAARHIVLQR